MGAKSKILCKLQGPQSYHMAMASKHREYYIICMRVSGFMTKVETSRVHVFWLCPVPLQDGWLHPCHGL